MNFRTKAILITLLVFTIITGVTLLIAWGWNEKDKKVVAEGEVIALKTEPSSHFLGGRDYLVQLNNTKWYEINEKDYYRINIGDYIIIYATDRIAIYRD